MPNILRYEDPAFSLKAIESLFREYHDFLEIDLNFQYFEAELASLPGKYSPLQGGQLYLIKEAEAFVGCAALWQFKAGIAEVKRLYVRPKEQGKGLGKLLVNTVVEDAKALGYEQLYLDSLKRLQAAWKLYKGLNFKEIQPYNKNPHDDVYYMMLDLKDT